MKGECPYTHLTTFHQSYKLDYTPEHQQGDYNLYLEEAQFRGGGSGSHSYSEALFFHYFYFPYKYSKDTEKMLAADCYVQSKSHTNNSVLPWVAEHLEQIVESETHHQKF